MAERQDHPEIVKRRAALLHQPSTRTASRHRHTMEAALPTAQLTCAPSLSSPPSLEAVCRK